MVLTPTVPGCLEDLEEEGTDNVRGNTKKQGKRPQDRGGYQAHPRAH